MQLIVRATNVGDTPQISRGFAGVVNAVRDIRCAKWLFRRFAQRIPHASRFLSRGMMMNDVTRILAAIEQGDAHAAEQLLPLVYDELRILAPQKMAQEKPGQTLNATALVHEAYLRLVGDQHFSGRGHFFAAAAEAMRRILIDNARRKRRPKHGGDRQRQALDELSAPISDPRDDLFALDEALTLLAQEEPIKAELVKLRYFAGLSLEESAACLDISLATAKRYWTIARAWLYAALSGSENDKPK